MARGSWLENPHLAEFTSLRAHTANLGSGRECCYGRAGPFLEGSGILLGKAYKVAYKEKRQPLENRLQRCSFASGNPAQEVLESSGCLASGAPQPPGAQPRSPENGQSTDWEPRTLRTADGSLEPDVVTEQHGT